MYYPLFTGAALIALSLAAQPVKAQPVLGELQIQNDDFVVSDGDIVIRNNGSERVRIDSETGSTFIRDPDGNRTIFIDQQGANLFLGGGGGASNNDDGDLVLFSDGATEQVTSNASIHLDGGQGQIFLGGGGESGQMVLRDASGAQRVLLDSADAQLIIGNGVERGASGTGQRGRVEVRNAAGDATVVVDGATGRFRANQIVSRASGTGGRTGVDGASVFVRSNNPAIGLLDDSGGNSNGWYVQSSSTGRLLFQTGTTEGIGNTVMVLNQDGEICFGACN